MYEGAREGRPPVLSPVVAERLRQVALEEGGTVGHIMQCMEEQHLPLLVRPATVSIWLKDMGLSYKRNRPSVKKRDAEAVAHFRERLEEVMRQVQVGQLALYFFDESGFSPNPPIQSGWSLRGTTRSYCPVSHRERVNVLGCLQKGAGLVWETLTHTVERADVIAFFDRLVGQVACKTIVVLDNAPIHRGEAMRDKQAEWEKKGLSLWYLPPYSPELNAIEILWKHAKYFWRRFLALSGMELQHEVDALMQGYGSEYTITFQ